MDPVELRGCDFESGGDLARRAEQSFQLDRPARLDILEH